MGGSVGGREGGWEGGWADVHHGGMNVWVGVWEMEREGGREDVDVGCPNAPPRTTLTPPTDHAVNAHTQTYRQTAPAFTPIGNVLHINPTNKFKEEDRRGRRGRHDRARHSP